MSEQADFFKTFLRSRGKVGAIAPISMELAKIMVEVLDWEKLKSVVEYGPGTGVFTEAISISDSNPVLNSSQSNATLTSPPSPANAVLMSGSWRNV